MEGIVLTNKQEEGVRIAVANYKLGKPYSIISGYAGAGKSTLIKFIIEALHLNPEQVAYVAYTGKAANVLRQKGCPNATTAHRLLYWARPLPNGDFIFEPRRILEKRYKLIVVDEVSMLPQNMWELLLSHKIHVLAAGDPGQLPPVDKEQKNNVLDNPDIFLDEIMRQAQESAIIRLSMHIREGKDFRNFPTVSGEVRIVPHAADFYKNTEDYNACLLNADQILCSTNKQRENLNKMVRKIKGLPFEPQIGDKVIGLTNHWDFLSSNYNPLTNGTIGTLQNFEIINQFYPKFLNFPNSQIMLSQIKAEDEEMFFNVPIDYKFITTNEMSLQPKQIYKLSKFMQNSKLLTYDRYYIPYDFTYAYAITVWKAQGSQWDYILCFDGTWLKHKEPKEYRQYLYTAVTRAVKSVILVGD